ncbi:hypothetical protein BN1708_019583, partial [Verticillium longisporum]
AASWVRAGCCARA